MKKGKILNHRIGEENTNCQGVRMRIVEYHKSNDITVLFLNGCNETRKTRYEHFMTGQVRCYSNIIGQKRTNKHGYECEAIRCVDSQRIEVRYSSGQKRIIKRTLFNNGIFADPKERSSISDKKMIPDCEGYYADKSGNIYNKKGEILHHSSCGQYLQVSLPINGSIKNVLVHRIIATTFIPNPNNYPQVNHIDGNKLNNKTDNLEWCTASENQRHAFRCLGKTTNGEKNSQHKLAELDVRKIVQMYHHGKNYKEIANFFPVTPSTIYGILQGYSWTHVTGFTGKRNKSLQPQRKMVELFTQL